MYNLWINSMKKVLKCPPLLCLVGAPTGDTESRARASQCAR